MKKTLILILAFAAATACSAQPKVTLTKQIVQSSIKDSLYPDSLNSDTTHWTVQFHDVEIAKAHRTPRVTDTYGIPGNTTYFPVLASYTVTERVQIDGGEPLNSVKEITQKFFFYKNEFGKWGLDQVSSSDNRETDSQYSGDQPPPKK